MEKYNLLIEYPDKLTMPEWVKWHTDTAKKIDNFNKYIESMNHRMMIYFNVEGILLDSELKEGK